MLSKSSQTLSNLVVVVFVALLLDPFKVYGHVDHDMESIQQVIYQYALGIINGKQDSLSELISQNNSEIFGPALPAVAPLMGIRRMEDANATYELTPEGVTVGPIAFFVDQGVFVFVWSFDLVKEGNGFWKIRRIYPSAGIFPEYFANGLAAQENTIPVEFHITDNDGNSVAARVHIRDKQGEYWPPRFHNKNISTVFRSDVGGDVIIDGKTFAYVDSEFVSDLPVGEYVIDVAKGMEYKSVSQKFKVTESSSQLVRIDVPREIDMASRGWYSGDTHIHFVGDHNALLEARAENLNVANVLAAGWGPIVTDVDRFVGRPSIVSTGNHIVYVNQETRHGWLGHTTMLRLKKLVHPLAWGGIIRMQEGVPGGFDYPPMAKLADEAHAQGGIVTWAHMSSSDGELAVDIALNKIDAVDLFTFGNEFYPGVTLDDGSYQPNPIETWYKFLNTGFRIPATAGTDKMYNTQVIGSSRTYAYLGKKEFSYDNWIEAIRAGKTYVTSGPQLSLTIDGEPIGSTIKLDKDKRVETVATVFIPEDYPAEVLEIVYNGSVVASKKLSSVTKNTSLAYSLPVHESGWVAARVRSSKHLPYQRNPLLGWPGLPSMAHTSPVYLEYGNDPVWSDSDAQFLANHVKRAIRWADTVANFRTQEEKYEMINTFKRALDVYEKGPQTH